jgi:hypothetical protein
MAMYGQGFNRAENLTRTVRIDKDVQSFFEDLAEQRKVEFQFIINETLREFMKLPLGSLTSEQVHQELAAAVKIKPSQS